MNSVALYRANNGQATSLGEYDAGTNTATVPAAAGSKIFAIAVAPGIGGSAGSDPALSMYSNYVDGTGNNTFPLAPGNLSATPYSDSTGSGIRLLWDNSSDNETGFTLQRSTSSGFSTGLQSFPVAADTTSYADTTDSSNAAPVQPGTTYYYRVEATNDAGDSGFSGTVSTAVALPIVSVTAIDPNANFEAPDGRSQDAWLDFHRTGELSAALTANVSTAGTTAVSGTDYSGTLPTQVTFDAGQQDVIVPVVPANGGISAGTIDTAHISDGTGYTASTACAQVEIAAHGLAIQLVNTSGTGSTDPEGDDELLDSSSGALNLQELQLTLPTNAQAGATFTLTIEPRPDTDTADLVDVWTTQELSSGATTPLLGDGVASYTWTVTANGGMPPATLEVGGISGSNSPGDLVFGISESDPAGTADPETKPASVLGVPQGPSNLVAKVVHGYDTESVDLSWKMPEPSWDLTTSLLSGLESGFHLELERATDPSFHNNVTFTDFEVPDSGPKYTDQIEERMIGVGFYYRIRIDNDAGNSAWSNVATTPVEPIIVGFYDADTPFTFPNPGNSTLEAFGQVLIGTGLQQRTFSSLDDGGAYSWLLSILDLNGDGKYDPSNGDEKRPVEIYGHSWGGTTAVELSQLISGSGSFIDKEVNVLAVLDPVAILRPTVTVPQNVDYFWNRYEN